jgi:3-hydroxybutyryl-CoA dehydrogenase
MAAQQLHSPASVSKPSTEPGQGAGRIHFPFENRVRPTTATHHIRLADQKFVILGAGNMGTMISSIFALSGACVTVIDTSRAGLEALKTRHAQLLNLMPGSGAQEHVLDRLRYVEGEVGSDEAVREILARADMVIEALPEDLALKVRVFRQLDAICPATTILATNSSAIPVSRLAQGLSHSERVCNTHFLQQGIAAVEVMQGPQTAAKTVEVVVDLLESAHLVPFVLQRESVGFMFNIIWRGIKKNCLDLVARGVAAPEDIDRIWMLALKTSAGPFGMMDVVGLDIVLAVEEEYARTSGNPQDNPPEFLREMVAAGKKGIKTGAGFYSYPNPAYRAPGFLEHGSVPVSNTDLVRESLLRTWRLVSYSTETAEGKLLGYPMGENVQGRITYTNEGRVWVHLNRPERPNFTSQDPRGGALEEQAAAYASCFFYTGRFTVAQDKVLHHIDICSFPNWSGRTEVRLAHLENGKLVLKTSPMQVGGVTAIQRLVWEPS